MKLMNTGNLTPGAGNKFQLQKPVQFPQKKLCERIRVVVTQNYVDAGGGTMTATDVANLAASWFNSWLLQWGDTSQDVIDQAIPFARLREMQYCLAGRDFYINVYDSTGSSQIFPVAGSTNGQLNAWPTAGITLTTGHTYKVTLEIQRNFAVDKLGYRQTQYCPGYDQMNQLDLSFVRGAIPTLVGGNLVESGSAGTINVYADTVQDKTPGRWAQVPRIRLVTFAGQDIPGVSGGGMLLGGWEYSSPSATTALQLFSLSVDDELIHDNVLQSIVYQDFYQRLQLGAADLNQLATVFFDLADDIQLSDIPTGETWNFHQAQLNIAQPQVAWCFIPPVTDQYRDGVIGANTQERKNGEVKLVSEPSYKGEQMPTHQLSCAPVTLVTRQDPAFQTHPGQIFTRGQQPYPHVPDGVTRAVQGLHAAHGSDSVLHKATVKAASAIPGAHSVRRGRPTSVMTAVAKHVATSSKAQDPNYLNQFSANLAGLS